MNSNQFRDRPWLVTLAVFCCLGVSLGCGAAGNNVDSTEISASGGTVITPDEAVSIQFPPGAVEDDLDVAISSVPVEDLPEEIREFTEVSEAYQLGPDGVHFDTPLEVEWKIDIDTNMEQQSEGGEIDIPLLMVQSDGGTPEFLDNQELIVEDGTFTLRGELDHFSWIVLTKKFFKVTVRLDYGTPPDGRHRVSEQFVVLTRYENLNPNYEIRISPEVFTSKSVNFNKAYEYILGQVAIFETRMQLGNSDKGAKRGNATVLRSVSLDAAPRDSTTRIDRAYEFTCLEEGPGSLTLTYKVLLEPKNPNGPSGKVRLSIPRLVTCPETKPVEEAAKSAEQKPGSIPEIGTYEVLAKLTLTNLDKGSEQACRPGDHAESIDSSFFIEVGGPISLRDTVRLAFYNPDERWRETGELNPTTGEFTLGSAYQGILSRDLAKSTIKYTVKDRFQCTATYEISVAPK